MDELDLLDLLEEHADLVTQLKGGDTDPLDELDMLERVAEIVTLLGGDTVLPSSTDEANVQDDVGYYNELALQKITENESQINEIRNFNPQGHTAIEVNRMIKQIDDVLDLLNISYPKAEMGLIPAKYKTEIYSTRTSIVKNLMSFRKILVAFVDKNKSDDYADIALAKSMAYTRLSNQKKLPDNDLLNKIDLLTKATENPSDYGIPDTSLARYKQNENMSILKVEAQRRGLLSDQSKLSQILSDLQTAKLSPKDLDLAEIDRLIADKTPENEAILGQIVDIVANSYQEKV